MEKVKIKKIDLVKKTILLIDSKGISQVGTNADKHFHQHRFHKIGVEKSPFYVIDVTFNLNEEANYLLWEPMCNNYFILKITEFETHFNILKS